MQCIFIDPFIAYHIKSIFSFTTNTKIIRLNIGHFLHCHVVRITKNKNCKSYTHRKIKQFYDECEQNMKNKNNEDFLLKNNGFSSFYPKNDIKHNKFHLNHERRRTQFSNVIYSHTCVHVNQLFSNYELICCHNWQSKKVLFVHRIRRINSFL